MTDDPTAIFPPTPPTPPEPPQPPSPPEGVPFYKRGWFIAVAAVAVLLIGYALGGGDGNDPTVEAGGSTTTTTVSSTTSAPEDSTTSTPETTTTSSTTTTTTPTTTTILGFEPTTVSGSGDDVIEFAIPNGDPGLLDITHDGSSNFVVDSFTADNEDVGLLVNEIGPYTGTRPINFIGDPVGLLEIQADGAWTITARPLIASDVLPSPASGSGDDVIAMILDSPSLDVTHTGGESNFVIWAWTSESRDLLVNEIGDYSGTVRTPTGEVIFEIEADGEWTLTSS